MSVKVMSMVYAAHFHDITFIHKGKRKATGEEYQKAVRVINSNLKSVCVALADHANDEGEGSYPAVETLADKTELSEVTVIACLKAMRQESIISYTGRSKWHTCNYTINKTKVAEMATWERQKRAKPESKAALVSKVKPLQLKSKAALPKPSIHPKPSLVISPTVAKVFIDLLGKFYGEKEQVRWNALYESVGKDRAEELAEWAFKKEIHLLNRGGLLDSIETASKNWREKPARTNGKPKADLNSLVDDLRQELANEQI